MGSLDQAQPPASPNSTLRVSFSWEPKGSLPVVFILEETMGHTQGEVGSLGAWGTFYCWTVPPLWHLHAEKGKVGARSECPCLTAFHLFTEKKIIYCAIIKIPKIVLSLASQTDWRAPSSGARPCWRQTLGGSRVSWEGGNGQPPLTHYHSQRTGSLGTVSR